MNIENKPAKIAIIGSGISGLACGYFLSEHHQLKLYEKNNYFGGHSNTANIDYNGKSINVDTGFIVFNYQTYPNLVKFFELLNIAVEKSNMSFAVKIADKNLEYAGTSLSALFAQKKNLWDVKFLKMIYDIYRFNNNADKILGQNIAPSYTLKNFINDLKLGEYFQNYYLLPMASAIWSCNIDKIGDYPAQSFVQFFKNHGLLTVASQPQWWTVANGSQQYVKKVIAKIEAQDQCQVSLNDAVIDIKKTENSQLKVISTKGEELFDKVIIATHSDQALTITNKINKNYQEILGNIKYKSNFAILHKDQSVMPKAKKAWASWVYSAKNHQTTNLCVSYWMNNLQNIDGNYPLFVTLNPNIQINPQDIFASYQYEHPVFDEQAIIAQKQLNKIQGLENIYFCGAYQNFGFHEDGFNSALAVLNKLQVYLPWQNSK